MLYKTMVLELLQQRPQMHDQLRQQKMLLRTMEFYARELKDLHEAWKQRLAQTSPGGNESRIASEAMEIALRELEEALPSASPPDGNEALSLEEAMAFIRKRTPPA